MSVSLRHLLLISVIATCHSVIVAAEAPRIVFATPLLGTVVKPGDEVAVTLDIISPEELGQVVLFIQGRLVTLPAAPRIQYRFSVLQNIPRGRFAIDAVARHRRTGELIEADPRVIIVEDEGATLSDLAVSTELFEFSFVGQEFGLSAHGIDQEGKWIDINDSSYLLITSNNESVIRVDHGQLSAIGPGVAHVIVSYGRFMKEVRCKVPAGTLRGDYDNDGQVDYEDLLTLEEDDGLTVRVPGDARDLNRDGRIDVGDRRELEKLCTYRECALSKDDPPPMRRGTPPTVHVSSPTAGRKVTGTVTIAADASDDGSIAGVRFFRDNIPIGSEDSSSPFTVRWNTKKISQCQHTLTAEARDNEGNTTTSPPLTIKVGKKGTNRPCRAAGMSCKSANECTSNQCRRRKCR